MFKNLYELLLSMPTEKACRDYLIEQRWGGKPVCPYCGYSEKTYVIEGGKRFKCGASQDVCGKKFSVTVGTIFESSRIPLTKWLNAVYVVTAHKKGISSHQLARDLGLTQRTAWFMIHRIREMMKNVTQPLEGVVEVDETYIGGRMANKHKKVREQYKQEGGYKSGHAGNKVGVMGLVARHNEIKVQVIDSTKQTLKEMVRANVHPASMVMTDSLMAYKGLDKHFGSHEIIHHEKNEFVDGDIHTNTVEGFFSLLKRGIIGIYHQTSKKHLQRYCDEFAYRYNTRKLKDCDRFTLSLQNMERRITWIELVKQRETTTGQPKWKIEAEKARIEWMRRPGR